MALAGLTRSLTAVALAVAVTACGGAASAPPPAPEDGAEKYAGAVRAAADRGLEVWVNADLVSRWRTSPAALDWGARRVAVMAAAAPVAGVRVADELGYDGATAKRGQPLEFVRAATRVLSKHTRAPLAVDLIAPELGCGVGLPDPTGALAACRRQARAKHPAVTLEEVDALLVSGLVDTVFLSTGLLDDDRYAGMGVTRDEVQQAAWREVARRGWAQHAHLLGRKALAHPGRYPTGAAGVSQAQHDLATFVTVPAANGAEAVDIWTWRQRFGGDVVRLMDPGLQDNALWQGLRQQHLAGRALLTHFSPSQVEVSVERDLDVLATAFTGVLISAGTG